MHKLHWLDGLLFVVAWLIIFHVILNFEFFFNFQMHLESCFIFIFFVVERLAMVIIYLFKCCTRQPDACDIFYMSDDHAYYTVYVKL